MWPVFIHEFSHRCRGTFGGKTRTSDVIASRCLASDWLADGITYPSALLLIRASATRHPLRPAENSRSCFPPFLFLPLPGTLLRFVPSRSAVFPFSLSRNPFAMRSTHTPPRSSLLLLTPRHPTATFFAHHLDSRRPVAFISLSAIEHLREISYPSLLSYPLFLVFPPCGIHPLLFTFLPHSLFLYFISFGSHGFLDLSCSKYARALSSQRVSS